MIQVPGPEPQEIILPRHAFIVMISLDGSILPAILIFLLLVVALNKLLFQPLLKVQVERERRTAGAMAEALRRLDRQLESFNQYQAAVKSAHAEGYRRQEQVRAEAMRLRSDALAQARADAERLVRGSRDSIQAQIQDAKLRLETEAQEIAGGIADRILRRTA